MLLRRAAKEQWQRFETNLPMIRMDLLNSITFYKEILPPTILGKLLSIRSTFESFYRMFGIFPDLFTREEKDWPLNKFGQNQNQEIRKTFLKLFERNLRDYFTEVEEFLNVLEQWKSQT